MLNLLPQPAYSKVRRELTWMLLPRYAKEDPRGALSYAEGMKGTEHTQAIPVVLRGWATPTW